VLEEESRSGFSRHSVRCSSSLSVSFSSSQSHYERTARCLVRSRCLINKFRNGRAMSYLKEHKPPPSRSNYSESQSRRARPANPPDSLLALCLSPFRVSRPFKNFIPPSPLPPPPPPARCGQPASSSHAARNTCSETSRRHGGGGITDEARTRPARPAGRRNNASLAACPS
jgi:hypothetical protein